MKKELRKESKDFISKEDLILTEELMALFESMIVDIEKSNRGNKAAARRFRVKANKLEKIILPDLRKITPKK
jgi:hypothetical protein